MSAEQQALAEFVMDPEVHDLIRGWSVRDGMVVRPEAVHVFNSIPRHAAWVTVTESAIVPSAAEPRRETLSFIGVHPDGAKYSYEGTTTLCWYVKRESMGEQP